jgi:hypothetical protein
MREKAAEAVYNVQVEGSQANRVGARDVLVLNATGTPVSGPSGTTDCCPDIQQATATEFVLVNPSKKSNFVIGELVSGGQLSFVVENLPKTNPQTGCPGRWMFQQMMMHFGTIVTAIQGNWLGASSDNLRAINRLTAAGAMTIEEAAKQTWTGMRAQDYGYAQVRISGTPMGAPGNYTSVHVVFTK